MRILIIGGTRNLGFQLVHRLLEDGHRVTTLNRGVTRDDLPQEVERLRADRTEPAQLEVVLRGRSFDIVVDNALYNGREAETIVRLLRGQVGHYIFLSSGQVYLVREGIERPFREDDYAGRLMPEPKRTTYSYEEWVYGMEKREAEDVLTRAWVEDGFPFTSLRLPMVNSERDHFNRLYNYFLRLKDGGPIIAPTTPNFALRHVYGKDVVQAMMAVIRRGMPTGRAYNISQNETVSLDQFVGLIAGLLHVEPEIVRVPRSRLEADGFLPDCSPFSERWMSELDNRRSIDELGMVYTPLRTYLEAIIDHYERTAPPPPTSYRRRRAEKMIGMQLLQQQQ